MNELIDAGRIVFPDGKTLKDKAEEFEKRIKTLEDAASDKEA